MYALGLKNLIRSLELAIGGLFIQSCRRGSMNKRNNPDANTECSHAPGFETPPERVGW